MKRKHLISFFLALTMTVGCAMPGIVNAATDANGNSKAQTTTQEVNEETQAQSVAVDATVASTFSVSVPKTIQLDGAKKSASYKVTCSGDFPANKKVTVVPEANVTLSSVNKSEVIAAISQNKTEWLYGDEPGTTGTITAEGLSAGEWNGSFNFNIVFADAHEHDFNIPVYKTIHHEEEGHYEEQQVLVEPERNEEVTEWVYVCNTCGMKFSPTEYGTDVAASDALDDHQWDNEVGDYTHNGYHSEKVTYIKNYPAKYETQNVWIVDKTAYDEEVVDYYKCECGSTRK